MISFLNYSLPWTNFPFTIDAIILSIPLLVIFAFVAVGFRYTCQVKNGFLIRGWFIAIVLSFVYGLITRSRLILAHRHFEYLMYPMAIIAVFGIGSIFSDPYNRALLSNIFKKISNMM